MRDGSNLKKRPVSLTLNKQAVSHSRSLFRSYAMLFAGAATGALNTESIWFRLTNLVTQPEEAENFIKLQINFQ